MSRASLLPEAGELFQGALGPTVRITGAVGLVQQVEGLLLVFVAEGGVAQSQPDEPIDSLSTPSGEREFSGGRKCIDRKGDSDLGVLLGLQGRQKPVQNGATPELSLIHI